jgi:DNA-binding LacI/PurR family transcriptional regulator
MKGASLVKRVDAVVVLGMCPTADEHAGLAEFGRPVITAPATTPGHVGVRIDDVHAARVATSHLLALGHGRIAYAGGPFDTSIAGQSARLAGYRALRREHAILQRCHALTAGAGLEAGSHLLGRRDRPTAILAGADEIAFGVLRAARELGLGVPDDVSVIGIDGHELAGMFGLTTVAQPLREHGRRAARHVLAALTGVLPPVAEELCADLILRSSTARAP